MLLCAVAAMGFVVPQARRARDRVSGFVPRACQGQPEEPPFLVGQRVEGLYGASLCRKQGLYGRPARLRAADWLRLAEGPGILRHGLELRGASGVPAGRGLSHLAFDTGASKLGVSFGCRWFAGDVTAERPDGSFDLQYEDGEREERVLPRYMRLPGAAPSPPAPPAASGNTDLCGKQGLYGWPAGA